MEKRTQKKRIEPEAIFLHAVSFHLAFRILHEYKPPHPSGAGALHLPASVLSAFTCELLLKALICIETGRVPTGHHLLNLFNRLSASTRERIEEIWSAYAAAHASRWGEVESSIGVSLARDLLTALKVASKTFELARYYYEEREEFQFYLGALPDMLRKVAFELKPDWAKHAEKCSNELYSQV
jgi:HEPN domain-containing protein